MHLKTKKILISDLSVVYFAPGMDNVVMFDALVYGTGAVLLHRRKNGNMKPVVHTLCSLIAAEKKV